MKKILGIGSIILVLSGLTVATIAIVKCFHNKYAKLSPEASGDTSLDADVEMDDLDI